MDNTEKGIRMRGNILSTKNTIFVFLLYHINHKLGNK